MTLVKETQVLREMLATLAADPDWALLCRYDLLGQNISRSLLDRWFRHSKNMLARIGLTSPHVTKYPWLPTLKHAQPDCESSTLLIWALGINKEDLREACEGFLERLDNAPDITPVLVTDVSDFYYFSRLKWLIEYVPKLSGKGQSYHDRKQQYLAWRYRDAFIVPVSVGRASEIEWDEVMEMIH